MYIFIYTIRYIYIYIYKHFVVRMSEWKFFQDRSKKLAFCDKSKKIIKDEMFCNKCEKRSQKTSLL